MKMPTCFSSPNAISPPVSSMSSRSLVVIDACIQEHHHLLAGIVEPSLVLVLDPNRDGVIQLSEVMQQHEDITQLHLVAHGVPGCLYLGNSQLSLSTLNHYALHILSWFLNCNDDRVTPVDLSISLYGCNVAAGDAGAEFIQRLHVLTGAKIAASTRPIGHASKGGTWELDTLASSLSPHPPIPPQSYENATHPPQLPIIPTVLASYPGILAPGDLGGVCDRNGWPSLAEALIAQPDGKILAIGWSGGSSNVVDFTVVHHNALWTGFR